MRRVLISFLVFFALWMGVLAVFMVQRPHDPQPYLLYQWEWDLVLTNADGSQQRSFSAPDTENYYGGQSPDGKWLVYSSRSPGGRLVLTVTNLIGTVQRQLVGATTDYRFVSFSPDSQMLIYETNYFGEWRLFSIPADPNIRAFGEPLVLDVSYDFGNTWSPDGEWFVFNSADASWRRGVYAVSMVSGEVRHLSPTLHSAWFRGWSPDGDAIVLEAIPREGEFVDLFLAPLDGTSPQPLVALPRTQWFDGWSPDGEWLLFSSDDGETRQLYRWRWRDAQAEVQHVSSDVKAVQYFGFADNWILYAGRGTNVDWDIYRADFSDPELTMRENLTPQTPERLWLVDWAKDRMVLRADTGEGSYIITLNPHATDAANADLITVFNAFAELGDTLLSPDDRYIYLVMDAQRLKQVVRVTIDDGTLESIPHPETRTISLLAWIEF